MSTNPVTGEDPVRGKESLAGSARYPAPSDSESPPDVSAPALAAAAYPIPLLAPESSPEAGSPLSRPARLPSEVSDNPIRAAR